MENSIASRIVKIHEDIKRLVEEKNWYKEQLATTEICIRDLEKQNKELRQKVLQLKELIIDLEGAEGWSVGMREQIDAALSSGR